MYFTESDEKKITEKLSINLVIIQKKKYLDVYGKEIEQSGFSRKEIEEFYFKHQNQIMKYSENFIKTRDITNIGSGFLISYTIFIMLFLKSENELLIYLLKNNGKKDSIKILDAIKTSWGSPGNDFDISSKIKQDKHFKKPKDFAVLFIGIISILYLLNISFGVIEFLPDNLPFVGNIDEALATTVLLWVINYFGIKIPFIKNKQ